MRKGHDYTIPLDEGERLFEEASQRAEQRVAALGIVFPSRPVGTDGSYFDGRLPSNINSFSMAELGEIHALMCEHADWVTKEHTRAKSTALNLKEKLKLVTSSIRKSKTGTAQSKEDDTISDARYNVAKTSYLEEKEVSELIGGVLEAATRDLRVISRLIEVKRVAYEQGRRDTNIRGKRRDPFS
tara:strand:+ start:550 stop:1104 length:555 start_codon:yes stop_codon:yes gene_type:complete